MDQEVYDKVMELLADQPDQNGMQGFATLVAFHYPDSGRALLTKLGALVVPEPEPPVDEPAPQQAGA